MDNGSTDDTADVARAAGAVVIEELAGGMVEPAWLAPSPQAMLTSWCTWTVIAARCPAKWAGCWPRSWPGRRIWSLVPACAVTCEEGALTPAQRWGNRVAGWFLFLVYRVRLTDLGPFRAISARTTAGA